MLDNSIIRGESIRLGNNAFRLYALLLSYCYGDKVDAWPSQETLGDIMSVSRWTVRRCAKELEAAGLIQIQRNLRTVKEPDGHRHRSNTYRLNVYDPL